ncbi:hypothetical protein [Flavobacterium sp.]|uniref:hypothetical protein n=1 Tax=Flavobacterium sp. TaxID=239 RepID=UPI003D0B7513
MAITRIDSTLRPGNDFFKYVNGKWYDSVSIPASQAGVGAYMFIITHNEYACREYWTVFRKARIRQGV